AFDLCATAGFTPRRGPSASQMTTMIALVAAGRGVAIAPEANLFEAGATSFDVVRFVDAARSAGFALAIADVFAAPSLAALGERAAHTAGQPATQARDAD
ncbi:acyl carrier protein, partial [Burkholderia pseudomallei]|uniref:acyl carrier protein n=1 Tax=Burkholderia pseudomallei TaxID=28450 RepID=UPI001F508D76